MPKEDVLNKTNSEIKDAIKNFEKLKNAATDALDELTKGPAKSGKKYEILRKQINQLQNDIAKYSNEIKKLERVQEDSFTSAKNDVNKLSDSINNIPIDKLSGRFKKQHDKIRGVADAIASDLSKGMEDSQHVVYSTIIDMADVANENLSKINSNQRDQLSTIDEMNRLKEMADDPYVQSNEELAKSVDILKKIFNEQNKVSRSAYKTNKAIGDAKRELVEYAQRIPIIGNYVENLIDDIDNNKLLDKITRNQDAFRHLGGAIAIVGVGLRYAWNVLKDMHTSTRETSTELGLSISHSEKLVKSSRKWAFETETLMDNYQDVLDSQKALTREMGYMEKDSAKRFKIIDQMQTLNAQFGVSYESGAKLVKQLTRMGSSLEETEKISLIAGNFANATNMAVNLDAVIEDIASNSASIYTYFKGGQMYIMKQVIAMKRLGMVISDVVSTTESIMDIESSLEKQMIAQVMLGREFNLDKARSLALSGDMEGSMDEILSKMGSVKDFNDMDFLQKQAVAEATGLTVDKLQEALYNQEKLNEMTGKQRREYDGVLSQIENMNYLTADQLRQQADGELATLKFSKAWDNVVIALQDGFLPLLEKAAPFIEKIAGWVNGLSESFKTIGSWFPYIIAGLVMWKTTQAIIAGFAMQTAIANIMAASAGSFGAAIPYIVAGAGIATYALINMLGSAASSVGDAVITDKGEVIHTSPDDYIMATKDPESIRETITDSVINNTIQDKASTNVTNVNNTVQTNSLEKKLDTLIALFTEVKNGMKQPIYLQMGNGAITKIGDAISLRKNMISGVDRGYGKILTT